MKPKNKKRLLGLGLAALLGNFAHAQSGMDSIYIEKYYVANAADVAGSTGVLNSGSVTYRVYVDMKPGWAVQAIYGALDPNTQANLHSLVLKTTTSFFNAEDAGSTTANAIGSAKLKSNTNALDSWFSMGAAAGGQIGVPKSEDNGAANLIFPSSGANAILRNNVAKMGIPLTTQDGIIAGTVAPVAFVGFDPTAAPYNVFDNISNAGNTFQVEDGSWYANNSAAYVTGTAATNRVLIGQFTTDGVFHYELNIQIKNTSTSAIEKYVAKSPQSGENLLPGGDGTVGLPLVAPTVNLTAPANSTSYVTGDVVTLNATAADTDGTVDSVSFFIDGARVGVDVSSPYSFTVASTVGTHTLTAKATDNDGLVTTSSGAVAITVVNNTAPTVSVTAPTNGTLYKTGNVVTITAIAADDATAPQNGSVASVQILVDGTPIATLTSAPYTATYTAVLGAHTITAKATDNRGLQTTSTVANITVANNVAPTISITAPAAGPSVTAPAPLAITVNAADTDGSVDSVEFFVDDNKVGSDLTSPYAFSWTSVVGTHNLTAKATDNNGAVVTSSAVSVDIADPNGAPYKLGNVTASCASTGAISIPFSKVLSNAANVIGYDLVLHYDASKVQPTGAITVGNGLINPAYATIASNVDVANSLINISVSLNNLAPVNASFNGQGVLFNAEFAKTSNFTSVDTALFTVTGLQESYNTGVSTKVADGGKFITYRDNTFHAGLKFWSDNSVIAGGAGHLPTDIFTNDATCSNKSVTSQNPDASGNFSTVVNANNLNGLTFNIERDIAGATDVQSVVNGYDAMLARKVVVQDPSFTPSVFQLIAMDVNMDGVISAGDVTQLNQRSVLKIAEFKQAWNYSNAGVSNGSASKDWLFVSGATLSSDQAYLVSVNYPANDGIGYSKFKVPVVPTCLPAPVSNPATCPLISAETYTGIMLGDVNGNYQSIPSSATLRTADKIVLDLTKAVINGNYVDVPVSFVAANGVNALDLALQLNNAVSYNSLVNTANNVEAMDNFNAIDSILRVTSNSLQNYDASQAVAMLRFATSNGKVNVSDIKSTVGYLNGERASVEVVDNSTISGVATTNFASVYPNPASDKVNVVVSQDATVLLFAANGDLVLTTTVAANQPQVLNTQNLAGGVYTLKIYNSTTISITKVVIAK